MVGKVKAPNAEERRWMDRVKHLPCYCCRTFVGVESASEIHHITDTGRRMGHSYTIPLCPWHHRGVSDMPSSEAKRRLGPSLARGKREFVRVFGTELQILSTVQSELAEKDRS